MRFKVGDRVRWVSQAGGYTRAKEGVVERIIPPRTSPGLKGAQFGSRRDESYVVRVKGRGLYWPLVQHLSPLDDARPHTTHHDDCGCQSAALRAEAERWKEVAQALAEAARKAEWGGRIGDEGQYAACPVCGNPDPEDLDIGVPEKRSPDSHEPECAIRSALARFDAMTKEGDDEAAGQ